MNTPMSNQELGRTPSGKTFSELKENLRTAGYDISNSVPQINSFPDGTFGVFCVRYESGTPIYQGRLEQSFKSSEDALAAIHS